MIVLGSWKLTPGVCGVFHDDAIYLDTARALADGDGYRMTGVPGQPLQTKYPFLWPLALSGICAFDLPAEVEIHAAQLLTLLLSAVVVGGFYLWLTRFGYVSRWTTAAGALLCATSPL